MKQVNLRIPVRILALVMGMFLSLGAYAQITVQGLVKDATGEGVIGASVRVVGTTQGTVTDFDGNFTLSNVPKGAKLLITSIGYQDQEVTAEENMVITMNDNSQVLNELVVIGYGVARKSDLTGSVTALKPDAKNKGVTVSAQDMLGGKIAGVSVTSGGGTPGGGATIRIRGGSSLNASNDPLIVIDGVPMDNQGVKGLSNGLAVVNPQDIESFSVLKDASATAIYGSRGSNGVIIITTKKGRKNQKPSVSYNGSATWSMKKKTIDVMDGDEFRTFIRNLYAGSEREETALATLGTANTNWQDEIYHTAFSHDHNITVTGSASQYLPFRLSLGYMDQEGILKTSDMKRFTAALNLNPSLLNDHLKMNLNGKFMWAKSRYADGGAIGAAVWFDPTQPVRVNEGYEHFGGFFQWKNNSEFDDATWTYSRNNLGTANPVALLELRDQHAISRDFIGNADIDYQVHGFEDLRLHLTLGADLAKGREYYCNDPYSSQSLYWGYNGWSQIVKRAYTLSTYAQYFKDFNEKHHFDIMAGYEYQHFWRRETSDGSGFYPATYGSYYDTNGQLITAANYPGDVTDEYYNEYFAKVGLPYQPPENNIPYLTENYLVSFFGRANYTLLDRYLFTATLRDDGSSRFYNHWELFPSFAFGWEINKEDFMKNATGISELKLRLGWGKTGQQEGIGDYGWIPTYSYSTSNDGYFDIIGDGTMVVPNTYNRNLKWEKTTTTNVGIDWGVLNQRLTGSIDWYYRKTTDLINYAYNSAGTQPRNMMNKNIGSLRNTGIEASFSWKALQTEDWNWSLDYNVTYNSNKILSLIGADDENYFVTTGGISSGTGLTSQAHMVGHPASSYLVYQQVYDENGLPIEGLVVDRNGDGTISPEDRYLYKSPMAPVTMGFASRLEYKNWDLGFSLRANIGNYVFNDLMAGASNVSAGEVLTSTNYFGNRPKYVLEANWQTYEQSATLSDRWVQNGSFLKCDNITLGYSFAELFKRGEYNGISGRVYATASNVFTITKYKGIDPEVFGGIDNNLYPRPFSFILGLSLNF